MPNILSRRSALSGLAVSVVGGIAGFTFARNTNAAKAKSATTGANSYGSAPAAGGKLLAPAGGIPNGGGVVLANQKIVLTNAGGAIHGFSAICTHQGCTVNEVSGGAISCPCHGSRFDARTGAVIRGPAPSPLPSIPVVVRGGSVYTA